MTPMAIPPKMWGWVELMGGEMEYRQPLPPTEHFPALERAGTMVPPYLTARKQDGIVYLDAWQGNGHRLGWEATMPNTGRHWIYVDSPDFPEIWKQGPVQTAIAELRERWPTEPIRYRPPDADRAPEKILELIVEPAPKPAHEYARTVLRKSRLIPGTVYEMPSKYYCPRCGWDVGAITQETECTGCGLWITLLGNSLELANQPRQTG